MNGKLKILLISIIHLSFLLMNAYAQDAPVTIISQVTGATPGTVAVPVTVTGFTNIGAVSLSIDYDYAVAQYINGTPNPAMPTLLSGDIDLGNGYHRINIGWFGSMSALPDSSTLITLNFNYTGGNTPITWFENGPTCEYATPQGVELNDTPTDSFYISGYLCGAIGNPGNIMGNDSVCQGREGEIYSVEPLPDVTGYNWSMPYGAIIMSGGNTNSITVDFSEDAVSGMITVNAFNPCGSGTVSQLPLVVNTLPYAHAGNDTTINCGTSTTLHAAAGGTGSYSYHWSPEELLVDPDMQDPSTRILLTTTLFTLTVTNDESSCQSHDEVVVAITGGPLSVNPIAVPGQLCRGDYAQLHSNAGGGSGNYSYNWTCLPQDDPPWTSSQTNPVVSPDTSKLYMLSVFDGYTETAGNTILEVNLLPLSFISGGDTLCGTGNITLLPVELTGTPPWSFIYTNGITSVFVNNQWVSPYTIITGDPGTYTITDLEDANCSGTSSGSATVAVFPIPETPEIIIIDDNLASSVCCGNQWYMNGEAIPGATEQVFHVTENGWYFVIVTINGCSSDTSDIADMTVGIDEINPAQVVLYPNPAKENFTISYQGKQGEYMEVIITSMMGQVVKAERFLSTGMNQQFSINIRDIVPGFYTVSLLRREKAAVGKLVKL
jgi:hypothetical protein